MTIPTKIPIRGEFDDLEGRLQNFDAYDVAQRVQIRKQKHVNIRSFVQDQVMVPTNMFALDQQTMVVLNTQTMGDLNSKDASGNLLFTIAVKPGEAWTNGAVGKQSDRNNWRGLSLTCQGGSTTTTESVLRT